MGNVDTINDCDPWPSQSTFDETWPAMLGSNMQSSESLGNPEEESNARAGSSQPERRSFIALPRKRMVSVLDRIDDVSPRPRKNAKKSSRR